MTHDEIEQTMRDRAWAIVEFAFAATGNSLPAVRAGNPDAWTACKAGINAGITATIETLIEHGLIEGAS